MNFYNCYCIIIPFCPHLKQTYDGLGIFWGTVVVFEFVAFVPAVLPVEWLLEKCGLYGIDFALTKYKIKLLISSFILKNHYKKIIFIN